MSTNQDKFCSECGYRNCPHEGYDDGSKKSVVDVSLPFMEDAVYNPESCNSLDHKTPVLQMQGINFAMMRYFGFGSSGSMLCYDWLKERRKQFPSLR